MENEKQYYLALKFEDEEAPAGEYTNITHDEALSHISLWMDMYEDATYYLISMVQHEHNKSVIPSP